MSEKNKTRLFLTMYEGEDTSGYLIRQVTLTCDPMGGTHPNPVSACTKLESTDGDFPSLERNLNTSELKFDCSMAYKPVTVTAHGTWKGKSVHYNATYRNDCSAVIDTSNLFNIIKPNATSDGLQRREFLSEFIQTQAQDEEETERKDKSPSRQVYGTTTTYHDDADEEEALRMKDRKTRLVYESEPVYRDEGERKEKKTRLVYDPETQYGTIRTFREPRPREAEHKTYGEVVERVSRKTKLTLTIYEGEDLSQGPSRQVVLKCYPAGGSHPDPEDACKKLEVVDGEFSRLKQRFNPCSRIYKPVTVTAEGTWKGRPISSRGTYKSDCSARVYTNNIFNFFEVHAAIPSVHELPAPVALKPVYPRFLLQESQQREPQYKYIESQSRPTSSSSASYGKESSHSMSPFAVSPYQTPEYPESPSKRHPSYSRAPVLIQDQDSEGDEEGASSESQEGSQITSLDMIAPGRKLLVKPSTMKRLCDMLKAINDKEKYELVLY